MVEMEDHIEKKVLMYVLIPVLIAVSLGVICLRPNRINMDFATEAEACFIYGDKNTSHCLTNEELTLVKHLFNDKRLYKDNLSCGFSEDISIKFNKNQTFCLARDTCPVVYWIERDRYIKLTEEEQILLYHLLEKYGFLFPCV